MYKTGKKEKKGKKKKKKQIYIIIFFYLFLFILGQRRNWREKGGEGGEEGAVPLSSFIYLYIKKISKLCTILYQVKSEGAHFLSFIPNLLCYVMYHTSYDLMYCMYKYM